jgi:hypothetical protein
VRADKTEREREAAVALKVLWYSFLGWLITDASSALDAATPAVLSKSPSTAFYGLMG